MTEDYLHYIWKHRLFDTNQLKTVDGAPVSIIYTGNHNHNAGPDFLEGRVKIGEQLWAGQIELHVASSDWAKHNHQTDKAYNSVILHVVYEHDAEAMREDGSQIPTLILEGLFDEMGYWRYEQFVGAKRFLACGNAVKTIDELHVHNMLDRVLVERLYQKLAFVNSVFQSTTNDWNETFYQLLFYAFGLKVNAETMRHLAQRIPLSIIRKHAGNAMQIEALLMGTAGFLNGDDDYQRTLNKEYRFLENKYALAPLEKETFKFARLRPIAFPPIRLAQLAAILNKTPDIFRAAMELKSLQDCMGILQQEPSEYWENHYNFGTPGPKKNKAVSKNLAQQVLINAVIPVLFAYADLRGDEPTRVKVFEWLRKLPAENNNIVRGFKEAGFQLASAADSQAVLQLHKNFCSLRKCLSCAIGVKLLKQ